MRRTCEECKVNVAYRWFLGLSIYDDIPNYSTWSQNYIRRYKDSDVFNQIFDTILNQAIEYGIKESYTAYEINRLIEKYRDILVSKSKNDQEQNTSVSFSDDASTVTAKGETYHIQYIR